METYSSEMDDFDDLLADAGYRIRPSDFRHVADQFEAIDSAMLDSDYWASPGPEPAHNNPSDLAAWIDSMLDSDPDPIQIQTPTPATCTGQIAPPHIPLSAAADEVSAIRLVRLLVSSADSITRGDPQSAASLLAEIERLLPRVGCAFGIGKVAGHFADALHKRLQPSPPPPPAAASAGDEILYYNFYEAAPYLKFAHFTANQAILEAIAGCDRVHVIDLGLGLGLQWPALIQALAIRPGGPPSLRLTAIGPHSSDGRDSLREIGLKLAELARSVGVRFSFRGIAANRLDDVRPWMLHVAEGEAIVVNSVLQLHKILPDPGSTGPVDSVLNWIARLRPKVVTLVEQEADHNKPVLLDRFTDSLFYYSAVFDSLDLGRPGKESAGAIAEVYLQREICNIVCCEGLNRVERHEPLIKWKGRMDQAGLRPVPLGSNAFKQASMLLALFEGEGFCVDEVDGCLMLAWHNQPLMSTSAWQVSDDVAREKIVEGIQW